MSNQPEILEIDVGIQPEDLMGPLGYTKGKGAGPEIMEQILSEAGRCRESLKGRAVYTMGRIARRAGDKAVELNGVQIEEETIVGSLEGAVMLAVGICTVGAGIDGIIEDHFAKGDFLRGMVADIVGSRAAEDVAEKCAMLICSKAAGLKLSASDRLSPGYGKWDVSGQRVVFALLDPSPIGVSLNDHCMMQPRKSVSFVIPLLEGGSSRKMKRPCQECNLTDCGYRRR